MRQNSNDSKRLVVDRDLGADNIRISAESPLPQIEAQQSHIVAARFLLRGIEHAAHYRVCAQHRKEIRGDELYRYLFR